MAEPGKVMAFVADQNFITERFISYRWPRPLPIGFYARRRHVWTIESHQGKTQTCQPEFGQVVQGRVS